MSNQKKIKIKSVQEEKKNVAKDKNRNKKSKELKFSYKF